MKTLNLILIILAFTQLVACTHKIDLNPKYDPNTKILSVDTLTFSPVMNYNEDKGRFGADMGIKYGGMELTKNFIVNDDSCGEIIVKVVSPQSNVYLNDSAKDRVMRYYSDACLSRNIGNIFSLRCMNLMNNQVGLFLTSS